MIAKYLKEQESVPILMDNYDENVLCDVILMETRHIILGRAWQYDHKSLYMMTIPTKYISLMRGIK